VINKLKCFIYGHQWEGVSWKANGKKAVDWAGFIVPEYDREECCSLCGKTQVRQYTSLADKIKR